MLLGEKQVPAGGETFAAAALAHLRAAPEDLSRFGIERENERAIVRENAAGEVGDAIVDQDIGHDGPGRHHLAVGDEHTAAGGGIELPNQFAAGRIEAVYKAIVRAKVDAAFAEHGREAHAAAGNELPTQFGGGGIETSHATFVGAGEVNAVAHGDDGQRVVNIGRVGEPIGRLLEPRGPLRLPRAKLPGLFERQAERFAGDGRAQAIVPIGGPVFGRAGSHRQEKQHERSGARAKELRSIHHHRSRERSSER